MFFKKEYYPIIVKQILQNINKLPENKDISEYDISIGVFDKNTPPPKTSIKRDNK